MATLLLGALLIACSVQEPKQNPEESPAREWLSGFPKPEITFFRISPDRDEEIKGETLRGYSILSKAVLKKERIIESLRDVLLDRESYRADSHIACFQPGMGFRFAAGDAVGDLVVCLKCRQIWAYDSKGKRETWDLSAKAIGPLREIYVDQVGLPVVNAEEAKEWLDRLGKVETTFLKISPEPTEKPGSFHGYPILLQKPLTDAKIVAELRSALTDPASYSTTAHKCFDPGMGIQFSGDGAHIDLVICLSCNAIVASKGDQSRSWLLSDEGKARLRKIYDACDLPAEKK